MRLKSVYISQYKNLKNFDLAFDGKNGTGKSNLFEALIEIFRHLYEYDKDKPDLDFNYRISLEIDGKETEIAWTSGQFKINGRDRRAIGKTPLPDNVLIYYSGHNKTIPDLVAAYEESFRKNIKEADFKDSRRFIGIGPNYKELLLAVLLMQPDATKARLYIVDKLDIHKLGIKKPGVAVLTEPVVKIVLDRPTYAKGANRSKYDIEYNDGRDRYWKPLGIAKEFLDRLSLCITQTPGGLVLSEGYFASDDRDRYVLYLDIAKVQHEFSDLTSQDLFRQFDNLRTLGMLSEITVPVQLKNGVDTSAAHFSDGQFQSVYIYAIIELFKDRNCITLLDEPDCFLHPKWQFDFLKQVFEIADIDANNNHVLISSHSAVTLIPHEKKKIKFFDIKDNHVNCYDLPKSIAINKLSADLIKYSEQEQLLSIINAIQIEKKPVLFTEGTTDPIIIKEAWYKLFEDDMPFIPFYGFSCTYLKQLLTDNRIHSEMGNLPVFALFDFDKAYDEWNGLNGTVIENDPCKGLIKKWASGNSYAIMIPVPSNPDIQKQVIKKHCHKGSLWGELLL